MFARPSITSFQLNGKSYPFYDRAAVRLSLKPKFLNGQRPPAETPNLFDLLRRYPAFCMRPGNLCPYLRGKNKFPRVGRASLSEKLSRGTPGRIFEKMPAFYISWVGDKVKRRGQTRQIFVSANLLYHNLPSIRLHGFEDEIETVPEGAAETFALEDLSCKCFMKAWIAQLAFEFRQRHPFHLGLCSIDAADDLAIFHPEPILSTM